jgi:DNA-binding XRE family transcriptional regulator
MKDLKERVKHLRNYLKIGSQEKLAEILEVNGPRVKSIETGRVKDLTAREANILVKKFNLNIDWLLTGEGEMLLEAKKESVKSQEPAPKRTIIDAKDILEHHITDKELEILQAYRSLPKKRQQLIYHKIKAEEIEHGNQDSDLPDAKYA